MWVLQGQHKRRIRILVAAFLLLMCWVSASSRNIEAHLQVFKNYKKDNHSFTGQGTEFLPARVESTRGSEKEVVVASEEACDGLSTVGSRPPSCVHRCEGCNPCAAIQVPTRTDQLNLQYANYEPEDWKCKCGNAFFDP
ncbi:EPIDERMAL PATTERNING FACTOR-like protein 2 [Papaver somniferum]|uniref:EPIDERMAL PATTERNING FACTOR-like protein 2 n=1 Tax=Papaver somniferum TaxID=3469 RepID=UPI000E705011|nr:EPIDERMAL PATTERNING FACTOR-like protein 2 [Papaver somniferum]